MQEFLDEINAIQSIDTLITIKEKIKIQIIEPQLHWETRILLYKKVKFINDRIQQMI